MPAFHKRGAAYRINPKPQDPNGEYAKTLRAKLQRKLEAMTAPPTKVTTLAEMSPEKQEEMRKLYSRKPPHPDDGELDYHDVFGSDGHK